MLFILCCQCIQLLQYGDRVQVTNIMVLQREVSSICRPTLVPQSTEYFIDDVALGRDHTALLTTQGQVLTLGKDHVTSGGTPTLISGISDCVTVINNSLQLTIKSHVREKQRFCFSFSIQQKFIYSQEHVKMFKIKFVISK